MGRLRGGVGARVAARHAVRVPRDPGRVPRGARSVFGVWLGWVGLGCVCVSLGWDGFILLRFVSFRFVLFRFVLFRFVRAVAFVLFRLCCFVLLFFSRPAQCVCFCHRILTGRAVVCLTNARVFAAGARRARHAALLLPAVPRGRGRLRARTRAGDSSDEEMRSRHDCRVTQGWHPSPRPRSCSCSSSCSVEMMWHIRSSSLNNYE